MSEECDAVARPAINTCRLRKKAVVAANGRFLRCLQLIISIRHTVKSNNCNSLARLVHLQCASLRSV